MYPLSAAAMHDELSKIAFGGIAKALGGAVRAAKPAAKMLGGSKKGLGGMVAKKGVLSKKGLGGPMGKPQLGPHEPIHMKLKRKNLASKGTIAKFEKRFQQQQSG